MARPEVHTLNSYAVSVGWTAPADMHSRRAMAMRRGLMGGAHGSELGKDVEPVSGYRLRYWVRLCRDGQPPVTEYGTMPEYVDVEETWPASASHAVLKWLVAGKAYIFEVAAFNHAGAGPWSDPSDCFIMPQRPEGRQPQADSFMMREALPSPAHLSPRPDAIEVSWAATCHRGSAITSYDLLCSKDPDFRQVTKQLKTTGESTRLLVKDLEPNTVYYFKHRAVNEKGPSKWSDPTSGVATAAKPPERPAAPARLGDTGTMPREVAIRWAAPESYGVPIQHYRVRCSTDPDMRNAQEVPVGADSRGTTNLSSNQSECPSAPSSPAGRRPGFNKGHYALTQLKVKGLAPMTTYYFQVQAVNQVGESEWSETSVAMHTTASPPGRAGRPRFCGGTKIGGMRICWTVPECFGARIERYDVRASRYTMMTGAVEHRDVTTRPADPSILRFTEDELLEATIPGCWDPAVDHFYQVRAVNSAGVGDWSESSEAFQVAPERPLRPEAPHSFDSLHRTALVRWKAPDCRGSPITGYRLQYSTARDMHYSTEVPGVYGTATEFAVTGLHPHGSYFFQVCALNAVGCSDWSPPSSLVKVRQVAPAKLSAPFLLRETSTSITVGFTNPADCGTRDGELIQTYVLYYCPAGQDGSPVQLGSDAKPGSGAGIVPRAEPSGVEVKGLRPGTRYQFQVLACNEYGDGAPSEAVEFGTASAPPDAPSAPWLSEFTKGSITLAVKPGRDNGAPLTDFGLEVEECETGKRWNMPRIQTCENDDGLQYYAVTGLRPGLLYRFRAAMVNREGDSPYSEPSEEYCTDSTPPEFVHGLRAEDVRARQYRLCWELPYHNGAEVTGYRVQWCQEETFEKSVKQLDVAKADAAERSAVLDDCSPGLPCYARVAARNTKGLGPFCRPLATDMGADVPDAPMHVQPVGVGPINVRLGWIMPYDCGSPITQVWVRYEETGADKRPEKFRDQGKVLVLGRKRFCSIEPLFSSREYVYRVAAQNAIGIGPWSEASLPTRIGPPAVPTAPEKPIFMEATTTSLAFKWNASEGMGANVLEQIVHVSTDPSFAEGSYLTISMPPWSATKQRQVGRLKHGILSPQGEDTLSAEDLREWEIKQGLRKADTASSSRPLTKSTAAPTGGPPTAGPSTAGPSTAPGASRPNTIGASRPVTTGQTLDTVSEAASKRPPSQQPIQVGGAEVLKLDSEEDVDDFGHEIELEMSYAQEVRIRRKSSSCSIDKIELGCRTAAAATIGIDDGEDAPQTVQLAESFDDIFPMEGLGAATMQRASSQYKRPELIGEYVIPELHEGTYYYIRVAGRNRVGLGPFSAPSERVATFATVPMSIPEDPGILLLRTGCTSLTLGWTRAYCQGMPITHYILRCSETLAGLATDGCREIECEEHDRETWPGIVEPQPHPHPLCPPDELDVGGKDGVVAFVTYLMQRFSSIEESWEWLDVNGSGDISKQEFMQGDEDDGGPPFEDFPAGQEALENVWKLLDADGGGVIGMSEYARLRPYFESVRGGGTGVDFKGIYCLVPSLKPGATYYFMARSVNKLGMSSWVHCSANPIKTDTMTPATMDMVEAVRELRTTSSVTLRWTLPWDGGNALTKLELRYQVRDIDDGVPDRAALRNGTLVELTGEDDGKGPLQTQLCVSGLLPGQVVIAIARAFNHTGGARMWSETPNASKQGHYQEAVSDWDCTTLLAPPELPTVLPYFKVDSLESYKCESYGEICFNVGRHNGSPFKAFDFEILDGFGELFRWWTTASSPEETAQAQKQSGLVRRDFLGLKPGLRYRIRVRCSNFMGASAWSELGPWATMPPDVPLDPEAPRSEFTSLSWVELKFSPPYDNGAKIEDYSIRTTMVADAEEDDWRVLSKEEVAESLRPYASTGRRMQTKDKNAMLCRVSNLKTGTSHFFSVRVRNSVGWSMWSETSCFVTKPARPGRVPSVASSHAAARDLDFTWEEPELNDLSANRYEIICGSNLKVLRWGQLIGVLLCTMPDTDRLFGELSPPELGVASGQPALRDLCSEETMFLALDGKHREHRVDNLLAGQDYYVAVRVVTTAGRGEFSEIFGPFETGPEKPCNPLPMEAQPLSEHSCRLLVKLPYDNGLPIFRASVVVHRSFGPLSHDELDLDTGDAKDHIAKRELVFDPKELPKVDSPGAPVSTRRKPAGITEAVLRSFRNEDLGPEVVGLDPNARTRAVITGQQRSIMLEGLRPGTSYRAQWAVCNDLGWSAWTVPEIRFETEPSHPDKPASMEIHGSL